MTDLKKGKLYTLQRKPPIVMMSVRIRDLILFGELQCIHDYEAPNNVCFRRMDIGSIPHNSVVMYIEPINETVEDSLWHRIVYSDMIGLVSDASVTFLEGETEE